VEAGGISSAEPVVFFKTARPKADKVNTAAAGCRLVSSLPEGHCLSTDSYINRATPRFPHPRGPWLGMPNEGEDQILFPEDE
jgi:hypothetical protein